LFSFSASINQCVDRHDPIDGEPSFQINRTSAASIEKPIHNVKVPMNEAEASSKTRSKAGTCVFISGTSCYLRFPPASRGKEMVEPIGIEPMT
jgi:hypothetical protein